MLTVLLWAQFQVAHPTFTAIVSQQFEQESTWLKTHFNLTLEKEMNVNESLTIHIYKAPNLVVELLSTPTSDTKVEGKLPPGIMKMGIPSPDLAKAFEYAKQQNLDLVTPIIEEDLMTFFILRSPNGIVFHFFELKGP